MEEKKIYELLNANLGFYLATMDVFMQLQINPKAEMCFNANGVQIRVTGEIEVNTDEKLRQEIFEHPTRKFLQAWKEKGIDNLLTVLTMKNCEAVTWTMETNFAEKTPISICNG